MDGSGKKFTGTTMDSFCQTPLPSEAVLGLECYNRQEFFEAHEHLETAWRNEHGEARELYRGILQVAVAWYHIQNGNIQGARKMLDRCRGWLAPFGHSCKGVNLKTLREDIEHLAINLDRHPDQSRSIDDLIFRPIEYKQLEE
jgi:hypothetical protein